MTVTHEFFTRECSFYVVPGDVFLFATTLPFAPQQGWLVDYLDKDTQVTTRYSVQDVILEVDELEAVPRSPGPPIVPALPLRHVHGIRVEMQVV